MNKGIIGYLFFMIPLSIIVVYWTWVYDISDEIILISIILFWIYHQLVVIRLELERMED